MNKLLSTVLITVNMIFFQGGVTVPVWSVKNFHATALKASTVKTKTVS